ncbi:MAG: ABC transporter permease [Omnitrophica WOR_2 bacterium]
MDIFKRSFLNLLRSPGRTVVVVVMLAVCLGLGLSMFAANQSAASQLGAVSGKIGTGIIVTPAGYQGLPSGDVILPQAAIARLNGLVHVVSVQPSLFVRYAGSVLLKAASPVHHSNGPVERGSPVQDLSVMGLDPSLENPLVIGPNGYMKIVMVDGTYFTAEDTNANVMLVGQALAETNRLAIGSTIDFHDIPVQVIGIYNTGVIDNRIIMPLATVQRLYELPGVNTVVMVADDVNNVDTIVREIRIIFDSNTADVLTATSVYDNIHSDLVNAIRASEAGMTVTFIVAAAVILLAMFLVMRQRVREIGILKAIGASNRRIGSGFGIETLLMCLASAVLGTGLAVIFAKKGLVGMDTIISPNIFLIAIGVMIALALFSSIVPIWYIARVSPAEVLRNE